MQARNFQCEPELRQCPGANRASVVSPVFVQLKHPQHVAYLAEDDRPAVGMTQHAG